MRPEDSPPLVAGTALRIRHPPRFEMVAKHLCSVGALPCTECQQMCDLIAVVAAGRRCIVFICSSDIAVHAWDKF